MSTAKTNTSAESIATKKPSVRNTKTAAAAKERPQAEPVTQPVMNDQPMMNEKPVYRVRKKLDPSTVVTVRNGFQGRLIYVSRKTGEKFEWEEFGYEQDMELQELKAARNASKLYFENNWFLIEDPEVIEYLGVGQYYKHALTYDNFDELFEMTADEIKLRIEKLSKGQRSSVVYRAKHLIAEGVIDSMKVINALEEALAVELIER